jgi:hypothetical protein
MKNVRTYVVLVFAMALAACASSRAPSSEARPPSSPSEPPASAEEKDIHAEAYIQCLIRNTPKYDDKRSDATTVGEAVKASCNNLWQTSLEAHARGRLAGAARREFYDDMQPKGITIAARIVLAMRTGQIRPITSSKSN